MMRIRGRHRWLEHDSVPWVGVQGDEAEAQEEKAKRVVGEWWLLRDEVLMVGAALGILCARTPPTLCPLIASAVRRIQTLQESDMTAWRDFRVGGGRTGCAYTGAQLDVATSQFFSRSAVAPASELWLITTVHSM
mmetsp:Transcript_74257/g.147560  ORF Transcript_74257/g.147560 Transcript_74257/m.147560 type:complete len:135 (+) Transcript_74257:492-896(+)